MLPSTADDHQNVIVEEDANAPSPTSSSKDGMDGETENGKEKPEQYQKLHQRKTRGGGKDRHKSKGQEEKKDKGKGRDKEKDKDQGRDKHAKEGAESGKKQSAAGPKAPDREPPEDRQCALM